MDDLTPRKIVQELDNYIIGQHSAKKAVAIALRNRWRRQRLSPELKDEVLPKNIIMIGPTGVGKTEIARRLSRLAHAPFVKVEASKFTEVGYVGRDVESMVRDLTEVSISMVKSEHLEKVQVREKMIPFGVVSNVGLEELEINLKEMLGNFLPEKPKRKKVKVPEAFNILLHEESNKLIDMEKVTKEAIGRVEQSGIIC